MKSHRLEPLLATLVALLLIPLPTAAQSGNAASRAASTHLFAGSELVAHGSMEVLAGGADLVVTSVEYAADKVVVVVEPVAAFTSATQELSQELVITLSSEVWRSVQSAARVSGALAREAGLVIGDVLEVVAINVADAASFAGHVASASAATVGYVLISSGFVVGVIALDVLEPLLGHGVHTGWQ